MSRLRNLVSMIMAICYCASASAQLSIEDCHNKAKENYPLIKQYGLIEKTKEFSLSNADKGYLPQFSISAKATYQSEVTGLPVYIPGKVGLTKDQYNATLDVNQNIWDGGIIKNKKQMAVSAAEVSKKQMDVDIYTIRERVNQLFFGILLLDAKLDQNDLLQKELQRNYDLINSYIENGIANQADLDVIKVEQLKAKQNTTQLKANRKAYKDMLAIMTGENIADDVVFEKPQGQKLLVADEINRPELSLFDEQYRNYEIQKDMIKTSYMPKLGLFATGGVGRPGLNMLDGGFSPYYIAGVKLSWNFGGLYTRKNDRRLLEVNQSSLMLKRETFLFNTNLEKSQEQQEINKNRDLLKYDDEIISLRNSVKKSAEVKVANGTMTTNDLMREVYAEDMARQDKIKHEIEFILSIYNLKFTTNN